ncbi:hypothetical protein CTI12_AA159180 [Artemisia annua]|uniref:RNA-directed DNA polymerase, eukaryota, Reverse transcriptase zinc-binding domain protein n=1 Tax=Artemisia annua TaxID=35608 RepID=A0A2U1PFG5_ARTAN|nr:hypothetical protein CTI12_AA159180 [Artemisia annua]
MRKLKVDKPITIPASLFDKGNELEDSSHLFSTCIVAVDIWNAIFVWLGITPTGTNSIGDLLLWIDNSNLVGKKKKVIEAVCLISCCSIWRFRNDKIFKNESTWKDGIVDSIKKLSFLWICNRSKKLVSSWTNWLMNPT